MGIDRDPSDEIEVLRQHEERRTSLCRRNFRRSIRIAQTALEMSSCLAELGDSEEDELLPQCFANAWPGSRYHSPEVCLPYRKPREESSPSGASSARWSG